jgi:hypothetical protein
MTPKQNAKELFDKICQTIATQKTDYGYYTNVIQAKQCALISVNELIKETSFEVPNIRQRYWLEVKQEIEKL